MNIVLSILQVLGWSLLAIVLLVVLLLLILLFCPLRYLVEGDWQEEKWAKFKAHWLFHLLRAKISYGDDLIYGEVSILWKKITFSHTIFDVLGSLWQNKLFVIMKALHNYNCLQNLRMKTAFNGGKKDVK